MKKLAIIALMVLSSCTYSVTLAHTEGEATDIVDTTSTPTADVDATANVPASVIP